MRTRVLIATTEGAVAVDRIVHSPLSKSIVCERNRKEPLRDFSLRYDEFVRRRIRSIAQGSPESAFRLDISRRIDTGDSWQLAALVAHTLHSADRLASIDHESEVSTIFLASGEIEYGFAVGAVGYIEEKLSSAHDLLKEEVRSGRRVIVALPAGNVADAKAEQERLRHPGLELLSVATVEEVLTRLDLPSLVRRGDVEAPWEGSPFRGLAVSYRRYLVTA